MENFLDQIQEISDEVIMNLLRAESAELELEHTALLNEKVVLECEILSLRTGDCWCEMGMKNSGVHQHSESCAFFQEWFEGHS
jgi:hypothetical protein